MLDVRGPTRRVEIMGGIEELGDPAAPPESPPWCKALYRSTVTAKHDAETKASDFKWSLYGLRENDRWRNLHDCDGVLFAAWEDFCQYPEPWGLGMSMAQVAAILEEEDPTVTVKAVLAKHGGDRRSEKAKEDQACDRKLETYGTATHTLARLRRDDPEMAERVERGELSANRAAVEKGWRKPPNAYRTLVNAWNKATPEERDRFEEYIGEWRRRRDAA